jgi:hypothetical protein
MFFIQKSAVRSARVCSAAVNGIEAYSLSEKSEMDGREGFWLCTIGSSVTLAVAGQFPFFRQTLVQWKRK